MATQNPFYVEPVNISLAVSPIVDALRKRIEKNKREKKLEEGFNIIDSGDHEAMGAFARKNPEVMQEISTTIESTTKLKNQELAEFAKRILINEEAPSDVMIQMAEDIISKGGDSTGVIKDIQDSFGDKEKGIDMAKRLLLFSDPKAYDSLYGKKAQVKDTRTAKQKDYEYGLKNPGFAEAGDALEFTDEQKRHKAEQYLIDGKRPIPGRGKAAVKLNTEILQIASQMEIDAGRSGVETAFLRGDVKALQGSVKAQEKNLGSMGSFVRNLEKQVDRVGEIADELSLSDVRLLNIPIRAARKKIKGDPALARYELYIEEISNEVGKLASGATGSVAELSQGAREKWEGIHDPNLSVADMLKLLKETKHAGQVRIDSVKEELAFTRSRLRELRKTGRKTPVPEEERNQASQGLGDGERPLAEMTDEEIEAALGGM